MNKVVKLKHFIYSEEDQVVTFVWKEEIPEGTAKIYIKYVGLHNDQMAGFYRSQYTDMEGTKRYMVSTQMEPIDARRTLPCWDEPNRKAMFRVTLVVDPHLTALSNMPEESSKHVQIQSGAQTLTKKEIVYETTPKMSSYLLAFVIGEFDYISTHSERGVTIRVYTPPGRSNEGAFALHEAKNCLDLYESYFGINYPLPKLDMIAIPEFSAGAMENWGLVTYRQVDLLIADDASASQKQRVAVVVNHELSHQWFGNLVTMDWWNDLWLNEGFASYMENYATQTLHPDYQMWEQLLIDHQASAMALDALKSCHPIEVEEKKNY